jgi:hypothetical protein
MIGQLAALVCAVIIFGMCEMTTKFVTKPTVLCVTHPKRDNSDSQGGLFLSIET